MQKIDSRNSLREAILILELKQAAEGEALKEQFQVAYKTMKPVNLLISTLKEAAASSELKANLLNTVVSLSAGYLAKVVVQGVTRGPLKKLVGNAAMLSVTNAIAQNPEVVQTLGRGIFSLIMGRLRSRNHAA